MYCTPQGKIDWSCVKRQRGARNIKLIMQLWLVCIIPTYFGFVTSCCSELIQHWQFRVKMCSWTATVVSVVGPVTEFAVVLREAKISTFLKSITVTSRSN